MGKKSRELRRLIENREYLQSIREDTEFWDEIIIELRIPILKRKEHQRIYHKIHLPGIQLKTKELEGLASEGKYMCGYLREPHLYFGKFSGLCALCEDFDMCKYPRNLKNQFDNDCPVFLEFQRDAINNSY